MSGYWLEFLSDGFWSIQLDIVGFLAVLGESSVLANGQVAHMSRTSLLPRLIPAPQALIRTNRPERLEASTGTVVGAHSGNIRRHVNHIPHILHQVAFHNFGARSSEPEEYHTRVIEIRWASNVPKPERNVSFASKKAADRSKVASPRAAKARTRSYGPLIFLAWMGFLQTVALLVVSFTRNDGMSLAAVLLLSFCSSLVGLGSYWKLELPTRTEFRDDIPPSDVIISYPNGSFLVVRCPEDIARLYFQTEKCEYVIQSHWQYRAISLVASVFLMIGVICLANAQPLLQVLWAAMYVTLNAAYWIVAALPTRWHWDMGSFETDWELYQWTKFKKEKKGDLVTFEEQMLPGNEVGAKPTFTEALWRAIALTKNSRWARIGEIAPDTEGWDDWLKQAMRASFGDPISPTAYFQNKEAQKLLGRRPDAPQQDKPTLTTTTQSTEKRDSENSSVDPENLVDKKSGGLVSGSSELLTLPRWNYNEALTKCLQARKRDSW